ncbi:hypothetical protein AVEN_6200-1 [Araneus ventricosus]|uniref:Uncharacterized protein n=1 Tax=Araneus ventricosus TaxID=182803 RepID=A0A4Y2J3H2_ARAVE|nr:hypothetical protein AVEN_6200-1 [Araneus ventricosus]
MWDSAEINRMPKEGLPLRANRLRSAFVAVKGNFLDRLARCKRVYRCRIVFLGATPIEGYREFTDEKPPGFSFVGIVMVWGRVTSTPMTGCTSFVRGSAMAGVWVLKLQPYFPTAAWYANWHDRSNSV